MVGKMPLAFIVHDILSFDEVQDLKSAALGRFDRADEAIISRGKAVKSD